MLSAEAKRIASLLEGRPVRENDWARETQGRPFFPDRKVDFSISHSRALAAVSLASGKNQRTGCDVERIRPRPGARAIAEEFFSTPERNYLYPSGIFDETRFYMIWTLKECYLKLRGLSVFDMTSCPSFIRGESLQFDAAVASPISFSLYEISDETGECYILATALEGTEQQLPEIRWFSQSFLACKSIAEIKAVPKPAETTRPKM